MSIPPTAPCPHELRPGTTTCLHCRSEARAAARARVRRTAARVGFTFLVIAVGIVITNAGSSVLQDRRAAMKEGAPGSSRPTDLATTERPAGARNDEPRYAAHGPAGTPAAAGSNAATSAAAQPRVAEGRTNLRDSMFVIRSGNSVRVHFDTPDLRTRRRDKFEQVVRATLPAIYGPLADSALAAVPRGQLVTSNADLLNGLPSLGLHLRVAGVGTLGLWPETRPGQDGPLVVAYRAALTR